MCAQSCLTLCSPMDCSSPGSSVHGIFQERILEWVAISFSRGSSWPRDCTRVSCVSWTCTQVHYQLSHDRSPEANQLIARHQKWQRQTEGHIRWLTEWWSYVWCSLGNGSVNYKLALAKNICQQLNDNEATCHLPLWWLNPVLEQMPTFNTLWGELSVDSEELCNPGKLVGQVFR